MGFALAVLLALSFVATALVAAAGGELRSIRAAERDQAETYMLHAAAVLAGGAVSTDPAQRTVAFEGGRAIAEIGGRPVSILVEWESNKLDMNTAAADDITAALRALNVSAADSNRIVENFRRERAGEGKIVTLDTILAGVTGPECVHQAFTIYGGTASWTGSQTATDIGWPPAGSRLRILVETNDDAGRYRGREYVVLITGNPARPVEVIDVRPMLEPRAAECPA